MTPASCNHHWPDLKVVRLVGSGLGWVRDQGPRGTCLAFATSAAHGAARLTSDSLSVEWLFWSAKQHDGDAGDGTTVDAIRAALGEDGQPEESSWAYDSQRCHRAADYSPPSLNGAVCHTRTSALRPNTVAAVVQTLDEGAPVVLGISLTTSFIRAPSGLVSEIHSQGSIVGFHAVLAVGHGPRAGDGTTHIIARNSWGPDWGASGYGLIAAPYLEQHLRDAFKLN